jgi:acyl dehydratase
MGWSGPIRSMGDRGVTQLFVEDMQAGRKAASRRDYVVQESEVIEFAREWDPQPFHLDHEAAEASVFGGLTACSAHIFAIMSKLGNSLEPQLAVMANLGMEEMRIPNPVRPGDRLRLVSECLEARVSRSKPDRGVVRFRAAVLNQRDEVVLSFVNLTMMRCRPEEGLA